MLSNVGEPNGIDRTIPGRTAAHHQVVGNKTSRPSPQQPSAEAFDGVEQVQPRTGAVDSLDVGDGESYDVAFVADNVVVRLWCSPGWRSPRFLVPFAPGDDAMYAVIGRWNVDPAREEDQSRDPETSRSHTTIVWDTAESARDFKAMVDATRQVAATFGVTNDFLVITDVLVEAHR